MDAVVTVAALVVGLTLGALGGGGSILLVPLLVSLAGQGAKVAIATSLLVVATTSAVAAVPHALAGRVQWGTALRFGAAGMVGAYLGGRVGSTIPDAVLLVAFALMMLATAAAMLRDRPTQPHGNVLVHGAVVGFVTGLVGAGGGFLVVPALAVLGGLSMPQAIGTSLVVVAMKSTAGLVGYLGAVAIDARLAASVTVATVVGALVGAQLVGRLDAARLRRSFAVFVLAMSVVVLAQVAA